MLDFKDSMVQTTQNPAKDCNPECKFHWQEARNIKYLETGIHSVESRIQDGLG